MGSAVPKSAVGTCRIGIIGAGFMAQHWAWAIRAAEEAEFVGVCSRTLSSAKKLSEQHPGTQAYSNVHDMWKRCKPDFVIIAVDITQTADVIIETSQYPWKILAEKPLGVDLNQAEALMNRISHREKDIFVALNRRFYESTARIFKEVRGSKSPVFIDVHDQQDTVTARKNGAGNDVVDRWMFANSIHTIDLLRFIGRGEIISIDTNIKSLGSNQHVIFSNVVFDSGDFGRYVCHWNLPGYWALEALTTTHRWEMKPLEKLAVQENPSRVTRNLTIEQNPGLVKEGLRSMVMDLSRASSGHAHSLPGLKDALGTTRLVDEIYRIGIDLG